MLPLFAYLALASVTQHAPIVTPKAAVAVNLHYTPALKSGGALVAAMALQEQSGIIDLREAAFGVLDRSAPAIARYARGPVVVLPLFAPTVERDTAYGAAVSLRMP
jgi:hypothetical protein